MLTQFLCSTASVLQHLSIYVLHDGHVSKSTCEIRWLTQNLGHWQHVERGCSKKRRDVIIKKLHEFDDNSVEIWTAREQTILQNSSNKSTLSDDGAAAVDAPV